MLLVSHGKRRYVICGVRFRILFKFQVEILKDPVTLSKAACLEIKSMFRGVIDGGICKCFPLDIESGLQRATVMK